MEREVFLARVRAATGGRPPESPPHVQSPPTHDRVALLRDLADRWRRPHAVSHHVDAAQAARTVTEILRERNLRRIAPSAHPLLAALGIPEALREMGAAIIPLPTTSDEVRTDLAGADAGITVAAYAVAETATLVERATPIQPRAVSLLPPVHIALVREEDVVATLDDLFAALAREPVESGIVLISGPSGTADIALQHVVGVHGPREIHLIVVDGASG